jgi:acyl carrier protein
MTKDEFYFELGNMLGLESGQIRGPEKLVDLTGWDSIGMVMFMALADSKLGVLVAPSDLVACQTVGDLVTLFPGKVS